jgi:hypothetical protein
MNRSIRHLALAGLLLYPSIQHAMEPVKQISLGLGAVISLGALAYAYMAKSKPLPTITMVPEHTPGIEGVLNPYLRFTLRTTKDNSSIGSICANYCPTLHTATIETLKVSAEHQKHGYGDQLWNAVIIKLKEEDIHVVTWKAVPIDLPPCAVDTKEYQEKLDTLVKWYTKRGSVITQKNSTEVDMKLCI